jgi:hypothetical protein
VYPLNDGGVLVHVGLGRVAVDRHFARYSSQGALQWAVWLSGTLSGPDDGSYVYAAAAVGHTIATAGLEHIGRGGAGNSALITLLDPDGNETNTIHYTFQNRQTQANDVMLISDAQLCAGGSHWTTPDSSDATGWVACWQDGTLVWERSFDKPVNHLRRLDATSLDVLTSGSWNTVQEADGAASNRRQADFGSARPLVFGENTLTVGASGASVVRPDGMALWSSQTLMQGWIPTGLTSTGTAYFRSYTNSPVLNRYETGVTTIPDPEPMPVLAAPTSDISQADGTCCDYCNALTEGKCPYKNRSAGIAECTTTCVRTELCKAEIGALMTCLKDRGALTCTGGTPFVAGCDAESAAVKTCSAQSPSSPAP